MSGVSINRIGLLGCMLLLLSTAAAEPSPDDVVYLSTSFRGNGEDGLRFIYWEKPKWAHP